MNEVIKNIVQPFLKQGQYLLDIAEDIRGNYIRIVVDSESTINLDDTTQLTKSIKNSDKMNDSFPDGYRLEVTTPGIDQSLQFPFQYRKNIDRELKVLISKEGNQKSVKGKIISANDYSVDMVSNGKTISIDYDQIMKANVMISFN